MRFPSGSPQPWLISRRSSTRGSKVVIREVLLNKDAKSLKPVAVDRQTANEKPQTKVGKNSIKQERTTQRRIMGKNTRSFLECRCAFFLPCFTFLYFGGTPLSSENPAVLAVHPLLFKIFERGVVMLGYKR